MLCWVRVELFWQCVHVCWVRVAYLSLLSGAEAGRTASSGVRGERGLSVKLASILLFDLALVEMMK